MPDYTFLFSLKVEIHIKVEKKLGLWFYVVVARNKVAFHTS